MRIVKNVALFKPFEAFGERGELAARVPAYRLSTRRSERAIQALQQERAQAISRLQTGQPLGKLRDPVQLQYMIDTAAGRKTSEAVNAFRTTTLDFDKGGAWTKTVNQFIPFFNVGIQSAIDPIRAMQEHPVGYAGAIGLGVVGPMVAAEAWNQHDPQMAMDYRDVPDYIKDRGAVLMLPGEVPVDQQGNRHPQFIVMPYRQLAPVAMAVRAALQSTYYKNPNMPDDERRSMFDVLTSMMSAESPVSAGSGKDLAMSIMPPGISTAAQLQLNEDTFRNKHIQSQYADERASPLSHALADVTGVGYPSQWEFGTRDFLPGYAAVAHGASELLAGSPNKLSPASVTLGGQHIPGTDINLPSANVPIPTSETPVVGGIVGRFVRGSIGGIAQQAEARTITPSAEQILKREKIAWRPQPLPPDISHIPLTRVEYGKYQNMVNRRVDEAIHTLDKDPSWSRMPKGEKEKVLEIVVDKFREQAKAEFLASFHLPDDELKRRLQREIDAGRLVTGGRR